MTIKESGVILLDKPAGITSFQALGTVKKRTGTAKVGHAGTLDKFATGLLIVLTGKCTKLSPIFMNLTKEYQATVYLGRETDTLDPEGEVIAEAPVPSLEAIEKAVPSFLGSVFQRPPLYSAVHVDGSRAHALVRNGKSFTLAERQIVIHSIEITGYAPPELNLKVTCSKGTYIRSLARDLGEKAGSKGYLVKLERTRIGAFCTDSAVSPQKFNPEEHVRDIINMFEKIPDITQAKVRSSCIQKVLNGAAIMADFFDKPHSIQGLYALVDDNNRFLALAEQKNQRFTYHFVGPCW